jgi:lysophospholipase L1-like esterase
MYRSARLGIGPLEEVGYHLKATLMNTSPTRFRARFVVFSMIPLMLLLVTAEVGVRLYDWGRGADAHARAPWYWGFVQDRLLGYRPRPNLEMAFPGGRYSIDTNAQGFRDADLSIQSTEQRRLILCMGESSTWGSGSSSRLTTWPHQVHEILNQKDSSYVVFNAGIPGYTVVENLQLLNLRLLKFRPEAVVYMGFRNDVEFYMRALDQDTDLNLYPRRLAPLPASTFNNVLMRSSLIAMAAGRIGSVITWDKQTAKGVPRPGPRLTARGEETFRDQIALMKDLCDRHGIRLIWVDQPVDYAKRSVGDQEAIKLARAVLHDELSKNRIPLLQAEAIYDFQQFPLIDGVHFSDGGNRYLASILAPQILAELNRAAPPAH